MNYRSDNTLTVTPLDWSLSPHDLFALISDEPWAMLLDSANASHQDAQFDIMVCKPVATLVGHGINPQFESNHLPPELTRTIKQYLTQHTHIAFDALKFCQQQLYPQQHACSLPFSAGALGAFGYDLGRSIEKLAESAMNDIHLNEINIGFYDESFVFDYSKKCWFHCFLGSKDAHQNTFNHIQTKLKIAGITKPKTKFTLLTDWHNQTTKEDYVSKFNQVQQYLLSGDCYQINLTQRFEAQYTGDEWQAYCALSAHNQAPFSAFIRLPEHCILSISPERFIQLDDRLIQTKPIKGTLPRLSNEIDDKQQALKLQSSEKDRAENVMIVDLLRNDIGKVAAAGSVNVPTLFAIESFPAVHHLVSTVTAILADSYCATDLLKAAFPGGSITGAPKVRAMQIIEQLEPSRRNMYCGSIGYISQDGKMDTSITIRTLVTENNKIFCWAGGGVVADSNAEAEYQESFDKVSKILPILAQL
ncbi:aminodeoxychorismate synthase component I [Shewanella aestuarii]|uniref:aminodeoxychorismate synthase n=1 Tax=Shewanella aestuarii TaxID=1028752 RepID=A0A6G9QL17_9GAMM|nr:aminodeoxychorismate synthase component I [Shewanella aestuarii]QIR14531.1 aminodeoxychorismate synthase component I [Shewanella aestuarii]